jgi:hypothetical protein
VSHAGEEGEGEEGWGGEGVVGCGEEAVKFNSTLLGLVLICGLLEVLKDGDEDEDAQRCGWLFPSPEVELRFALVTTMVTLRLRCSNGADSTRTLTRD